MHNSLCSSSLSYLFNLSALLLAPRKFYSGSDLGIGFTPVTFPSPLLSEMLLENYRRSTPQISLPGRPMNQPRWHHSFLFCQPQEMATLFTHSAALVFEFFPYAGACPPFISLAFFVARELRRLLSTFFAIPRRSVIWGGRSDNENFPIWLIAYLPLRWLYSELWKTTDDETKMSEKKNVSLFSMRQSFPFPNWSSCEFRLSRKNQCFKLNLKSDSFLPGGRAWQKFQKASAKDWGGRGNRRNSNAFHKV